MQNNEQYILDEQVAFNQFLAKVFMWMFVGLAASGLTALFVASTPALYVAILTSRFLFFGLIIGELILVGYFVARVHKMSYSTAISVFLIYSVINGLTLSVVFIAYTAESIVSVFVGTALIFGVMAVYGYFTKTDLSAFRAFFMIGIFGIIIMTIVNIFVASSGLMNFISYVGIAVFAGLTAYDIQKLRSYYYHITRGNQSEGNLAVVGALNLYLDFINIFLFLLRIVGRNR